MSKKKFSKKEITRLEREAAQWDKRKGEKNLWENLGKEGWADIPVRFVRRKDMRRYVDVPLLKRQASYVGRITDEIGSGIFISPTMSRRRAKALRGVWELLHAILDDLETGKKCILEVKR